MKKTLAGGVGMALAAALLLPGAPAAAQTGTAAAIIDPNLRFQTVDGFGVSMVDQVAGESGLPYNLQSLTASARSQVENDLFATSTGAGLNILRIELGAGATYQNGSTAVPDYTIEPTSPGSPSATPSYQWNGDADGQVQMARDAIARGVNDVYADAWSAPAYMKTNGSVYGGTLCGLGSCASGDWRTAYANYLTQYVKDYAASGVTINQVSPFNEPDFAAPWQSMTADATQIAQFDATLSTALTAGGLSTQIASSDVSDAGSAESYQQAVQANSSAAAAQSIASFHSYGGTPAAVPAASVAGKHSWQSEYTCVNDTWNTAYSTGDCDGQFWAQKMYTAMNGGLNAYLAWTGAWSHTDNEDLIRITGNSSFAVSSRLWVMGNYARFVRPGAVRVESQSNNPNLLLTAYRNTNGNTVLVATNTGAGAISTSLTGLNGGSATGYLTNDGSNLAAQAPVSLAASGSTTLNVPASSTETFVVTGATDGPSLSYTITNVNSGKVLSVANSDPADGTTLWQYGDAGVPAQRWTLTPVSGGYYEITSASNGKAVSVQDSSTADDATVWQWTNYHVAAQQWKVLSVGSGGVLLQGHGSGLLLSIRGAGTADGGVTNQFHLVDSPAQVWTLTPH